VTAPVELIREGIPRLAPGRLTAARCALCAPSAAGEEDAFALTRDALARCFAPPLGGDSDNPQAAASPAIGDRRGATAVISRPGCKRWRATAIASCATAAGGRTGRAWAEQACSDRTYGRESSGLMSALTRIAGIVFFLFALSTVVATGTTRVQESRGTSVPHLIGIHRDWNIYKLRDDQETICYIASKPKKQEGNYTQRGNPAVVVTRRPGAQVLYEVSVQPGYTYLYGSDVEVQIDQRRFLLFTRGEHAWARKQEDDRTLISAMRRGVKMTVSGTSFKNTYSLDTYSLLGFTAAFDTMVDACSNAANS
jgi:Invasion associated locus B (IalB) protein